MARGRPGDATTLVANFGDGRSLPSTSPRSPPGTPSPWVRGLPPGSPWLMPAGHGDGLGDDRFVAGSAEPRRLDDRESAVGVGHVAEDVAIGTGATTAWVVGLDGTVVPVDLATSQVDASIGVGGRPSAITIPPLTR